VFGVATGNAAGISTGNEPRALASTFAAKSGGAAVLRNESRSASSIFSPVFKLINKPL
jgi:hypothetical protein